MPTLSHEKEFHAWLGTRLNGDTELKTSGINPANGASRAVAIYSQPVPNAAMPYVRYRITDAAPIEAETFGYSFQPVTKRIRFTVDVFSTYEPELLQIQSRVTDLLKHAEVTTTSFHGSTWMESGQNLPLEDVGTPDKAVRHYWLRFKADLEPR